MTIELGGVALNPNLYLNKRNSASLNSVNTGVTVDGYGYTMSKPYFGGRQLSLGTMNQNGRIMGMWCQQHIDALKILEQNSQPITLDYHGEVFSVLIMGMDLDSPLYQNQVEGPGKLFTGEISLMEVQSNGS